jgi:DNA ligase D-like protein (predicted 3'-phosphoesterase)
VVQEHAARRHHFDLRLEIRGVLVSWAVPKGPSLDPRVKRLAIQTEDHPLEYAGFEGEIPSGEYGAGAVIVWDQGTYRNLAVDERGREVPLANGLRRGRLRVWLEGTKLRGGFALTRAPLRGGERDTWLLVKMRDAEAEAGDPVRDQPESVLSGRTLVELRKHRARRGGA